MKELLPVIVGGAGVLSIFIGVVVLLGWAAGFIIGGIAAVVVACFLAEAASW